MVKKFDSNNVEDLLPLSHMQSGMLMYYLKNPESDIYFEKVVLDLKGRIEENSFIDTWNIMVKRNEMLRTAFAWEGVDNPVQIILKEHLCCIELYGRDKAWEDIDLRVNMYEVPFKVVLHQYEEEQYKLAVCSHHILYDGWSTSIILEEFITVYRNLLDGAQIVEHPKGKYKDFIKEVLRQDREQQRQYWSDLYSGFDFAHTEYFKSVEGGLEQKKILNHAFFLEDEENINQFVGDEQITFAVYLYAAWAVLTHKNTKKTDISFGTTVSGRKLKIKHIEKIVGLFINTVPLRLAIDREEKIVDFLQRVKNILLKRDAYESTSIVDIKQDCGCSGELFDSIVVFENYPIDKDKFHEVSGFQLTVEEQQVQGEYNFIVNVAQIDRLYITISYNEHYIGTEKAAAIAEDFQWILEKMYQADSVGDLGLSGENSGNSPDFWEFEDFDF